jgi:O-antigen/teichoic acid export membrane protein
LNAGQTPLPRGRLESVYRRIENLRRRSGIDRAVGTTVLMRLSQAVSSLVLLVLVARTLSKVEQGYYFTFNSVVGLQIFFELGLTFVLMQYASHEAARLVRQSDGSYQGDADSQARLASLLRFGVKWYSAAALLVLGLVLPLGIAFFTRYGVTAEARLWIVPWVVLVVATACTLLFNSVIALFEGCGEVAEVAQLRLRETVFGTIAAALLLLVGAKLFAVAALVVCDALTQLIWLIRRGGAVRALWRSYNPNMVVHWLSEVWPFQWRIAISWLSGYFIFQIFNPILFAASGAVEAGKMGMTITACAGLSSLGMSWISTKVPRMGSLVSLGDRRQLDHLFFTALRTALAVESVLALCFWFVVTELQARGESIAGRFLEPVGLALMLIASVATCVSFSQAAYLRAHKQEPFLIVSVLAGVTNAALALTLAPHFGARGVAAGYAVTTIVVGVGLGSFIFTKKRAEYMAGTPFPARSESPVNAVVMAMATAGPRSESLDDWSGPGPDFEPEAARASDPGGGR